MSKKVLHEKLTTLKKALITDFQNEKISPQTRAEFLNECAVNNRITAWVILSMLLAMESLMVIFYILDTYFLKKASFFPQYIYLYLSMIILSLCFMILFKTMRHSSEKLLQLELAMLSVVGVWSAVFSAYDVINGFSSYLFIQLMIINSLLFKVEPVKHCVINALSFFVYAVMILFNHLNITITFAELVNPFFMLVASCVIIFLNHRTKYKVYINQKLIIEQHKELEFYANNDFLTKIPNHKSIVEALDGMLSENTKNITCMMIDIDNFKLYNDTYGHIVGDSCLLKLASVIEQYVLSQGGKVGRYGGEEFLALFSEKEEALIVSIATGLIRIVREQNIEFSANRDTGVVTISGGVYLKSDSEHMDISTLLTLADQELYRAKKDGKNRVSVSRKG